MKHSSKFALIMNFVMHRSYSYYVIIVSVLRYMLLSAPDNSDDFQPEHSPLSPAKKKTICDYFWKCTYQSRYVACCNDFQIGSPPFRLELWHASYKQCCDTCMCYMYNCTDTSKYYSITDYRCLSSLLMATREPRSQTAFIDPSKSLQKKTTTTSKQT